jgi:hypothetical protein
MNRLRLIWILLLFVVLALPTGSALAAPGSNPLDRIITGDDYVLDDGEKEDGNVVVLGGSVEIRDGAVLDGDLIVMGGDVEIGGVVTGNVVVMGGDVEVLEDAHIHGDCVLVGGDVAIDQGALIDGEVVTNPEDGWFSFDRERHSDRELIPPIPEVPEIPRIPEIPEIPPIPPRPEIVYHSQPSFAERAGGAFLSAIAAGVIALLIALFLPRHTDQVRQVVVREPVMSGVVGFLTFLAAVLLTPVLAVISAVLVLVCIGLLGFPIIILLWLAVAAGAMLGFAAIGQLAGRWISERLGLQGMTVALETGLGAFALSLVVGFIQAIGCVIGVVGGLLNLVIFSLALGAVVLTRFGRQDYQQGQPIFPQWPAKRPAPPEPPVSPVAPLAPSADEPPVEVESPDVQAVDPNLDSKGPFPDR